MGCRCERARGGIELKRAQLFSCPCKLGPAHFTARHAYLRSLCSTEKTKDKHGQAKERLLSRAQTKNKAMGCTGSKHAVLDDVPKKKVAGQTQLQKSHCRASTAGVENQVHEAYHAINRILNNIKHRVQLLTSELLLCSKGRS